MITKKIGDFTGISTSGISEAIKNALEKAGEHSRFEVIETTAQGSGTNRQYQVTLSTYND
ncbi:dodecin domain-containing protein [Legionella yabuuchiae]|uniref:dodecin domain-containing protein n=1 Tax=Legionella yabuuchiae TaxID=376727 RepID=UPI00105449EB|nr:dodecin domain-containing protein [Legionella yabuuchiae]